MGFPETPATLPNTTQLLPVELHGALKLVGGGRGVVLYLLVVGLRGSAVRAVVVTAVCADAPDVADSTSS